VANPRNSIVKYDADALPAYAALPNPEPVVNRVSALGSYLDILIKYRLLIFVVTALVVTVVGVYSYRLQPVYRATTRLEIDPETPLIQTMSDLMRGDVIDPEMFLSTQADVLQSDTIAKKTVDALQLAQRPEFRQLTVQNPQLAANPVALETTLIEEFKRGLSVDRQKGTRVMQVHFDSTDPQLAALAANTVVDKYIDYTFTSKYDANRQTSAWMEQQLKDLRAKVQKSQEALVEYEAKNSIVNVADKQSVAEQKLADLTKDLTEAQNERVQKQSLRGLVATDASRLIAESPLLESLRKSEADLRTQYADASQAYGPTFPKVKRLQAQLDEVRGLIAREQRRLVDSINNDYQASTSREQLLEDAVAKQKIELARFNELAIQDNLLKRDFETNQSLYDTVLQRMKDATMAAGLRGTNVRIIDRAVPPLSPDRPRKVRNIGVAFLGGIIVAFLFALVRETMDYSVRAAEDVEMLTGLPTLSVVPDARSLGRLFDSSGRKKIAAGNISTALLRHPGSPLSESFRTLRTSLLSAFSIDAPHVLVVTSPSPNEGKTCTALNLALALACNNREVLLIDADFRRPGIARSLGIPNTCGLGNVLNGSAQVSDAVVTLPRLPRLSVLPTGTQSHNPADSLSLPAMSRLLKALRFRYNSIVIDSPPVLALTDATILGGMADGVIMVAKSGHTTRNALARACQVINLSGGKLLGTVLNKVNARRGGYYDHYHYYNRASAKRIV
jgi:polysaccharide biosynthesis transport protein